MFISEKKKVKKYYFLTSRNFLHITNLPLNLLNFFRLCFSYFKFISCSLLINSSHVLLMSTLVLVSKSSEQKSWFQYSDQRYSPKSTFGPTSDVTYLREKQHLSSYIPKITSLPRKAKEYLAQIL